MYFNVRLVNPGRSRGSDGVLAGLRGLRNRSVGTDFRPESHGRRASVGWTVRLRPRPLWLLLSPRRLSDYGIRFVWNSGLLGPKTRPDGWGRTFQSSPAGKRTITKFTGRKRTCRCKPPLGWGPAGRRPWAWPWARATWRGSACPPGDVDFIQLSKIRGAVNGDV